MCGYANLNKCLITKEVCPYMYFCDRLQIWKPSKAMPEECPVKERFETPKGSYRVIQERKGILYIDVNHSIVKIENPFDYVPKFVKMRKTKKGWKVRE